MSIEIDAARPADLDQILILESVFGQNAWSADAWRAELEGADRDVLVARQRSTRPDSDQGEPDSDQGGADSDRGGADSDLEVVGVVSVQCVDDSSDMHRLVVGSRSRRGGVGTALIDAGVAAARHRGAARMLLEVEADNDAAIATYQRYGFEQLGSRPDYYGPGRPALIMKLYDLSGPLPVSVDWVPGGEPVPVDLIGDDHG